MQRGAEGVDNGRGWQDRRRIDGQRERDGGQTAVGNECAASLVLDNCGVAAACAQFMMYDNTIEMSG